MKITLADNSELEVEQGTTIQQIFADPRSKTPPFTVAAKMDYELISLKKTIDKSCRLTPVTMNTIEGRRIYQKSLSMVLLKAFYDTFPGHRIKILHSLAKGVYCKTYLDRPLTDKDTAVLKARMQQLIDEDIPFEEETLSGDEALEYFEKNNLKDKVELLRNINTDPVRISKLRRTRDLWYYPLVYSTGVLRQFDLIQWDPGLLLRLPERHAPDRLPALEEQKQLFAIFCEDTEWSDILEITNVGELNSEIRNNTAGEIIKIAEALHEKKIARIADEITANRDRLKFILIAGPSSSGKTSFSKRLAIQLRVNGVRCESISTDDYFVGRDQTPLHANGEYNFESLGALDVKLLNRHMQMILDEQEIEIPKYCFQTGQRTDKVTIQQIPADKPVIIEGIHCLNPQLTASIPRENKYLIYVSALTQLNIDDFNRIPTTDNRILRRMVRDSLFRGYEAQETLSRWRSVRMGEDQNIFPYQEQADVMFNTALIYELAVLKSYATPLLRQVERNSDQYSEAQRLLNFLNSFLQLEPREVPPTSILREFIGNSAFHY